LPNGSCSACSSEQRAANRPPTHRWPLPYQRWSLGLEL